MAHAVGFNTEGLGSLVATLIEEEGNWEKTKKRFLHSHTPEAADANKGFAFFMAEKHAGLKVPDHAKAVVEAHAKQVKLSAANKAAKQAAFEAAGGASRYVDKDGSDPLK